MNTISKYKALSFGVCVLLLAGLSVHAQNDGAENPTNAAIEAATIIISNTITQLSEMAATNDVNSNGLAQAEQGAESTNAVIETNLPTSGPNVQPGPKESRREFLMRQRAGTPDTNEPGRAGDNLQANAGADSLFRPVKPEYNTFKLITERNIFDPNRVRRGKGPPVKMKTLESFALVGLMSYEKGTFAFFDGSSSDYRKAVKLADTIAGYKVTNINANAVKLASGTNQVELRVGMQLRREEGGDWVASTQSETYASDSSAPAAAHTDSAPASGADNDVLERLRKRRDQE